MSDHPLTLRGFTTAHAALGHAAVAACPWLHHEDGNGWMFMPPTDAWRLLLWNRADQAVVPWDEGDRQLVHTLVASDPANYRVMLARLGLDDDMFDELTRVALDRLLADGSPFTVHPMHD